MSRPKLHIQQNDLFCKNLCGYFGNPQWGGFCSKCYKELIQSDSSSAQAAAGSRKSSVGHDARRTVAVTPTREPAATMSVGTGFSGFEEKKKKTLKMGGFFKKKVKSVSPDRSRLKVTGLGAMSDRDGRAGCDPPPSSVLTPPTSAGTSPVSDTVTPTRLLSRPLSSAMVSGALLPASPDPEPQYSPSGFDVGFLSDVVFTCLHPPYCLYLRYAKSPEPVQASPRTSHLSQESIQIHKVFTEFLAGLSKTAADDVRRQIQMNMESCISAADTSSSDEMSEIVQNFYNTFHDRVHTKEPYYGVAPELRAELEDMAERYLTTRLYRVLFTPLSQELEEADLAVQKRIRSLYWVGAQLLELNIDEANPDVTDLVEHAITDIIEMDSKRTPQDKLVCVSSCVSHLLEMLCVGRQGEPPSADDLLPALIFVVLRANPPRLQSNVQYVTKFSSQQRIMSGQQGYDFTNLCCAVSFIESMSADSLGLTPEEYDRYMSGDVLPPAAEWESGQYRCQGLRMMESNTDTLAALQERQNRLLAEQEQLNAEMDAFSESVAGSVDASLAENPLTLRPPKRPAQLDSPSTVDGLPAPLVPQSMSECAPLDADALARLPSPPPGLLAAAQDSLSSVLTLSQMTMEPPASAEPGPEQQQPDRPADSAADQTDSSAEELSQPPQFQPSRPAEASADQPSPPPQGPTRAPDQPPLSPTRAADQPPLSPTGRPSQPPPPPPPARAGRPGVGSIPTIPCSTGGDTRPMPVPAGPRSAQQEARRRQEGLPRSLSHHADSPLAHSPAQSPRRMSELPRSLSYVPPADSQRRMSEFPRGISPVEPGPRRASLTRTELLAQEARRFSLARAELARGRLQDGGEERPEPAAADEHERRLSARDEVERRCSVRPGGADPDRSAAATAALAAECEAAKQRSRTNEKQDKIVKVLSGIFSLTDNF